MTPTGSNAAPLGSVATRGLFDPFRVKPGGRANNRRFHLRLFTFDPFEIKNPTKNLCHQDHPPKGDENLTRSRLLQTHLFPISGDAPWYGMLLVIAFSVK